MEELFEKRREHPELTKAEVNGVIPEWVNGTLVRNAPAKFELGEHAYRHWFDGLALIHSFVMEKGEVSYRSRYLRSKAFLKGEEQKRIVYAEFGTAEVPDPCQNIFSRFFSYFTRLRPKRTDNCPINVYGMKSKLFAGADSPYMHELDPDTLEHLDTVNVAWTDLKSENSPMVYTSAHPHEDKDGNVFHLVTSLGLQTKFHFIQVPTAGEAPKNEKPFDGARILASIEPRNAFPYYHSFGLTPNYFIFVENPISINAFEVLTMKMFKRSLNECMHWDEKESSRFYLVERQSGECLAIFEAQGFFAFHHVNAYEDGEEIVVDICCYPDASIIDMFYLHHLRNSKAEKVSEKFTFPEVRRYHLKIPGNGSSASPTTCLPYEVLGSDLELPRINYNLNGMPYRFVYGSGPREKGHYFNQLLKLDTKLKERKTWFEPDSYPSEPVFVPKPGAKDEDDGVILSSVVGTRGQKSFLLILDACSFKELARASVPGRLPQSSHGNFFPTCSQK